GMVQISITSSGDLWTLEGVPPQIDDAPGPAATADWASLFREAGLKLEAFTPTTPRWVPASFGDQRAAWEGSYPEAPDLHCRVEAASFRGQPVFFHIYWPWNRPLRADPFRASE